jgi:hypothetical protein
MIAVNCGDVDHCPISPNGVACQYSQHGVTSPNSNYYSPSPVVSPGDWNMSSPARMTSPHSDNASYTSLDCSDQGSPFSAPATLAISQSSVTPPRLPSELGNKIRTNSEDMVDTQKRVAMKKVNQYFISKSALDHDREKLAIRQANSLLNVTQGKAGNAETTKKVMITNKKPVGKVVIVPDGREHMATSTWKGRKTAEGNNKNEQTKTTGDDATEFEEHVDDFKCELDRERQQWAQRQALRLLKGAGSFL